MRLGAMLKGQIGEIYKHVQEGEKALRAKPKGKLKTKQVKEKK